ncbi:hypothetical protein ACFOZ1_05670 [Gracilibacillus marinus]|uniref:Uncharacterized protein n=1 Tax=Gracilibacillus marinus TaxID=630535 RepID=A0ABV8VW30_9BACI
MITKWEFNKKNLQLNKVAGFFLFSMENKKNKGRGETGGRTYGEW